MMADADDKLGRLRAAVQAFHITELAGKERIELDLCEGHARQHLTGDGTS